LQISKYVRKEKRENEGGREREKILKRTHPREY
jgi:hypothetical protein